MSTSRQTSAGVEGRVVIVTGAGRGLGLGIAKTLLARGAKVAAAEIDLDRIGPLTEELTRVAPRERVLAAHCDVADADSFERFTGEVSEGLGVATGLVNNAGVIRLGPALSSPLADWDWQFRVNVQAVVSCSQHFARRLEESSLTGSIVNIASNAGKVGYPNMAGYNASKAAVINLTRTLSSEWAERGINVNAVCPGGVATPMLEGVADFVAGRTGEDPSSLLNTMVPAQLGRHIEPEEVGAVVAFLLSDEAQIIRGQSLNVDGGETPY